MDFYIEAACGSSIGVVRGNNEDNFYFDGAYLPQENAGQKPPLQLSGRLDRDLCLAVLDGMGGGDYGEVASYQGARQLQDAAPLDAFGNLQEQLQALVEQMNQRVWDAQVALGTNRAGSTLAMVYLQGDQAIFCNVGDSRIFALREGRLLQVSQDHTDEAYMKAHNITGRRPRLTQYLGMDPGQVRIEPFVDKGTLHVADQILICSDGLTDMVSQERIVEILTSGETADSCVRTLIRVAEENGGKDNITVILCRILERVEHERNTSENTLEGLADQCLSWGRKLWNRVRDTAQDHWRGRGD